MLHNNSAIHNVFRFLATHLPGKTTPPGYDRSANQEHLMLTKQNQFVHQNSWHVPWLAILVFPQTLQALQNSNLSDQVQIYEYYSLEENQLYVDQ